MPNIEKAETTTPSSANGTESIINPGALFSSPGVIQVAVQNHLLASKLNTVFTTAMLHSLGLTAEEIAAL